MAWIDMTSTISVADYPDAIGLVGAGLTANFWIFNSFDGPGDIYNVAAVRECAAYAACQGWVAFGYSWAGACPTVAPSELGDLSSWGNSGPVIGASITSSYGLGSITTPSDYHVGVGKSGLLVNFNPTSTAMSSFFYSQAPGALEYEVTSASVTVTLSANGNVGTDWTGILRKPAIPDRNPHFIRPSEFGSYPQIGTIAPAGGTSLSLSLAPYGTSFRDTVYVSTDLGELGSQDLGLTSTRGATWVAQASSVAVTWRYRTQDTVPNTIVDIGDLGLNARVYFEP